MNAKTIEYLNLRKKKLKLALDQIKFRERQGADKENVVKEKIRAKLEEIEGMMERLKSYSIEEMITMATEAYNEKKKKKGEKIRKSNTDNFLCGVANASINTPDKN